MSKKCKVEGCNETNLFTHGFCYKHKGIYYNSKPKVKKEKPKYMQDEIELAKIKKEKIMRMGNRCILSNIYKLTEQAHIIRRDDRRYKLNPRNLVLMHPMYHFMFDNGKGHELLRLFPWRMKAILKRMKSLDELYFNRYCGHNGISIDVIS